MNKDITSIIDRFLNDVSSAGEKISIFSQNIDHKDKVLSNIIEEFNRSLNSMSIDEKENEFAAQLKETLTQYQEKSHVWMKFIGSYIHGKEFINQFEKSVLFIVFGNVNVGKSSIGNFIAGSTDVLKEYYKQIPQFYVYDFADNRSSSKPVKMEESAFKENFTEETTTIQYYTLNNGLTWVDSPGIHSINGENEALAKKYVDYADLVLFVMSSSSPAKYDEFMEISRLIDNKKPLLIVINKSDKIDYDEVNGELVKKLIAKSDSDRKKQEMYVKELFENNPSLKYAQSVDSISISTHLAKKALSEDNNSLFIGSGMPRFYDKLGVMLKEKALELKKQGPRQRVNSLIEEILNGFVSNDMKIDGIYDMQKSFEEINSRINQSIEKIKQLEKRLLKDVRTMSMADIDLAVSKMSATLQGGGSADNLQETIEKIILDNLNNTIQKHICKLINDFKYENIKDLNLKFDARLEAKYENFTYTEYSVKEVNRNPEGIIEHIGSFFGKKYTKIKTQSHQVEKQLLVGDNSSEIIENIIFNLENELQPVVSKILDGISENYFAKEKNIVATITQKLKETENALNKELM